MYNRVKSGNSDHPFIPIQNLELNEFSKIDCAHLLTAYSSSYISCSICAMKIEAVLPHP